MCRAVTAVSKKRGGSFSTSLYCGSQPKRYVPIQLAVPRDRNIAEAFTDHNDSRIPVVKQTTCRTLLPEDCILSSGPNATCQT